nr:MAG TPA: hypothetical protein [Caudoviricetes sp.]
MYVNSKKLKKHNILYFVTFHKNILHICSY